MTPMRITPNVLVKSIISGILASDILERIKADLTKHVLDLSATL